MKVIPTKSAEELYRGSLESQVQQVEGAVAESHTKFGGSDSAQVELIATFPGYAVVMNEEGEFFRAKYKTLDDGGVSFVKVDQIDVPVLRTRDEKTAYVQEAAIGAVTSLFNGDFAGARQKVQELVRSSEFVQSAPSMEALREKIEAIFDDDRDWRSFFEEHGTQVRKYMWGASGATVRYAPKPKYQSLYTGKIPEDPSGHTEAIAGDLEILFGKLGNLWGIVEEIWPKYQGNSGQFQTLELSGITEQFEGFATDFIDELKGVCRLIEQASKDKNEDNTVARAMIYDKVARSYPDIEIAARFIQRVSTELAAA